MLAIKTIDLCKNYKDLKAVNNLNLEIEEGEIFSLLGVNGAGKTTTIKMLSCLIEPSGGEALVFDKSIRKPEKIKQLINVSPQETAVAQNLTVKENIELIRDIYGIKSKTIVKEMIESLGLSDVINKKASKLSGGMQRRLSIAMALITSPKILFLDEPSLGLDVISRRELWKKIVSLKGNMTIILTTHYMEEAEYLSDHIGIMANGKLLEVGTSEELVKKVKAKNFEDAFISIVSGGKHE